jgi:hypothetical protein
VSFACPELQVCEQLSRLRYSELYRALLTKDTLGLSEEQVRAIKRQMKQSICHLRRRLCGGIERLSKEELYDILFARDLLGLTPTQANDIKQRFRVLNAIRAGKDRNLTRLRRLLLEGIVHMSFDDLDDAWYYQKELKLNDAWVEAIKRELKKKSYEVATKDRIAVLLDVGVDYLDRSDLEIALNNPEGFDLTEGEIWQIKRRLQIRDVRAPDQRKRRALLKQR